MGFLLVVCLLLVAVAFGLSLAHALEMPGKMRLRQEAYLTVQEIYYPGFVLGGLSEPLAIVALLILVPVAPVGGAVFWLAMVALCAMIAVQGIFWLVTQKTNRRWLKHRPLHGAAARFFGSDSAPPTMPEDDAATWQAARDSWETSHVARAVLAGFALLLLAIAAVL